IRTDSSTSLQPQTPRGNQAPASTRLSRTDSYVPALQAFTGAASPRMAATPRTAPARVAHAAPDTPGHAWASSKEVRVEGRRPTAHAQPHWSPSPGQPTRAAARHTPPKSGRRLPAASHPRPPQQPEAPETKAAKAVEVIKYCFGGGCLLVVCLLFGLSFVGRHYFWWCLVLFLLVFVDC
ncbi:unnamed protein product, partial [Polarella glacialis]